MLKRAIFMALQTEYDLIDGEKNFIPCRIIEGDSGYSPMRGGADQTPWYWGKTFEKCQDICNDYNQNRGVSPEEAEKILCSSMFKKDKIKPVCNTCGSDDVKSDAYAVWDIETQDWILDSTYPEYTCEVCSNKCSINWEDTYE